MTASQLDIMSDLTKYIVKTGNHPYKNNVSKRIGSHILCGITCMPCYIWSIIMRMIACPVQCMCNGPAFMCSNNHCTTITDSCIGKYIKEIDKKIQFSEININKLNSKELAKVLLLAEYLIDIFSVRQFNITHYILCDVIIKPLTSTPHVLPNTTIVILNIFKELILPTVSRPGPL